MLLVKRRSMEKENGTVPFALILKACISPHRITARRCHGRSDLQGGGRHSRGPSHQGIEFESSPLRQRRAERDRELEPRGYFLYASCKAGAKLGYRKWV